MAAIEVHHQIHGTAPTTVGPGIPEFRPGQQQLELALSDSGLPPRSRRIFRRHKRTVLLCVVRDSNKYLACIQLLPAVEHLVIHTHCPSPGPPPATRLKEAIRGNRGI
ncbi:MAG: hypothetical protein ACD_23C01275G0001 [uncultured bacterium]|nr:MAG: hypothetical protein ACD_23C01275G0001 [uncultured bacterium]